MMTEAIVLDCGSCTTKAGFASSQSNGPSAIFPTSSSSHADHDAGGKDRPVEHGMVKDWDAMKDVWRRAITRELGAASTAEHPVLSITRPHAREDQRRADHERTAQLMFEDLGVPALAQAYSATMAIHGANVETGIVLDSGDGLTQAVPVYRGKPMLHAVVQIGVGGSILTERMHHAIVASSSSASPSTNALADLLAHARSPYDLARDMKEKLSFVPIDSVDFESLRQPSQEGASFPAHEHLLPDGRSINVPRNEPWRFEEPEGLFAPASVGIEDYDGLQWSLDNAISKCDMDIRRDFWENVVLCGGNTMIKGFAERLKRELSGVVTSGYRVRVLAPPDRIITAWRGGASMAQQTSAQGDRWVTKLEYEENGTVPIDASCSAHHIH